MRIAFGTDETTDVTVAIQAHLTAAGHQVAVVADPADWPDAGRAVGEEVAAGRAEAGVVCCWTGTGVTMAANKVAGVRAALCGDGETARGARRWNDANVLAVSLRLTSAPVARELLDAFLATPADPAEAAQVAKLAAPPGRAGTGRRA
ncbi:MAG: RpiB/LacA/LacB family sugar-phosphate isomerase [Acidimicrobiales bacterium]